MSMSMEEQKRVVEENQKLKEENEQLLKIVGQMKTTLDRLITRYVMEEGE